MERWDIYDKNKQRTGRTMARNDWCLKDDEYHLTVLGVVARPDKRFLITKRVMTKHWAPGWWEVSGGAVLAGEDSGSGVRSAVAAGLACAAVYNPDSGAQDLSPARWRLNSLYELPALLDGN